MKAFLRPLRSLLPALIGPAFVACASTSPPSPASPNPPSVPQESTAANPAATTGSESRDGTAPMSSSADSSEKFVCDFVCERAQVVARPADPPDYTAQATESANRVLEGMKGDLVGCYKKRLVGHPQARGFLTVQITVGADGHVRSVDTMGGETTLGTATIACVVKRIQRGVFEPHHGGGSMEIRVPFSMRRADPDET